jgi:RNA polymerase sigma factor (sigma-70 family)
MSRPNRFPSGSFVRAWPDGRNRTHGPGPWGERVTTLPRSILASAQLDCYARPMALPLSSEVSGQCGNAPGAASEGPVAGTPGGGLFHTTRWSVVLAASGDISAESSAALEQLCRAYWMPVFVYARRCGWNVHNAEDLTQEFFHRLLDRRYLAQADPQKGRFRNFLLVAFKHFLANEWDRANAVKRGGRVSFISIDQESTGVDPWEFCSNDTPEQAFARSWALVFLDRVMARLRDESERPEQRERFDALKHCLMGEESAESYAQIATRLGTTEAAVKMAAQRLRQRFAAVLREEIAQTVTRPDEIEDEIRCLFAAVAV